MNFSLSTKAAHNLSFTFPKIKLIQLTFIFYYYLYQTDALNKNKCWENITTWPSPRIYVNSLNLFIFIHFIKIYVFAWCFQCINIQIQTSCNSFIYLKQFSVLFYNNYQHFSSAWLLLSFWLFHSVCLYHFVIYSISNYCVAYSFIIHSKTILLAFQLFGRIY